MPSSPKSQRPVELINDTSSLSPSSNAPRFSDASVGHLPTPPPSAPPSTAEQQQQQQQQQSTRYEQAPQLPATPQSSVNLEITPEPTSSEYLNAAVGNSPHPLHILQHQQPHQYQPQQIPNGARFSHNENIMNRFNLHPPPSQYTVNPRFTMTAPVQHLPPNYFNQLPQLQNPPALSNNPLPPSLSDSSMPTSTNNNINYNDNSNSDSSSNLNENIRTNSNNNSNNTNSINSNTTSNTDVSVTPSRPSSLLDTTDPATTLSHSSEHDPRSHNAQDIFDPVSLGHSRTSDVDWQVSSAEPNAIHAGASPHIDEQGLTYDFNNECTKIGQGTYGSVYMGQYFGEHVAIKRIRIPSVNPNLLDDDFILQRQTDAIRQFAREIRKYERVSHPGIVRFYGVTLPRDEPSALLVTEFMEGDSLSEAMRQLRIRRIKFDIASVVRISLQACGGLRALHNQNCTWGDAKPENILLTERLKDGLFPSTGEARIADFGLSKSAGQTLLADTTIGGSGQPAGTYRYMSPESFSMPDMDNLSVSKACDIYSFGVVIYEMITLRLPWKRRTMNQVLHDVKQGSRPEWPVEGDDDYNGAINSNLKEIVEKCWLSDYKKRPSAEQLFNSLENSLNDVTNVRNDQRPLSVLNEGSSNLHQNGIHGEIRDPSIVSTVVPIGGSVELSSHILESTTESRRIGEIPDDAEFGVDELDDEAVITDGAESAPVYMSDRRSQDILPRPTTTPGGIIPSNPTVSPVTSPEPRSKRNSRLTEDDSTPQEDTNGNITNNNVISDDVAVRLQQFNLQNTNESIGDSQTGTVKHMAANQRLLNNDDDSLRFTPMSTTGMTQTNHRLCNGMNNSNENSSIHNNVNTLSSTGGFLNVQNNNPHGNGQCAGNALHSGEFFKYRDEFAQELGRIAATGNVPRDTDEDDENVNASVNSNGNVNGNLSATPSGRYSSWDHAITNGTIPPLSQQNSTGSNLMGSNMSSSASSRRTRSSVNVQGLIEAAAKEFLAYRKLKQSKLTPQRKREQEAKEHAEAERIKSEKESLSNIYKADEVHNYSIIILEMKNNRPSQSVVRAGMNALEKYCRDENLYLEICEEGGVEELVSGATLHGKNESGIAISFCKCIVSLSDHSSDKVGHILRAVGVPSIVIEKMNDHLTNIEVQRAACESLSSIAASSELSRSAVATLGGPAAVYIAMTKNNSAFRNADLAKSALKAIRYIAQDNEKAADYLVQVCALDTVSRAAEVFTTQNLEGDILSALRAFSFYDSGRRKVIMSSGLNALTLIMLRNQQPEFLVSCCTFIRAIARWRDHECEAAMLESCISSRIVMLMLKSNEIPGEDGAKVAWYSSHACTFLASFGSRSRQRLREEGAIETAIAILKTRKENARVVHSATDALAELLKGEEESKRHAEAHQVIEALNEALVVHRHVVRVRKALEWTLNYLTSPPRYDSQVYQPLSNNNNANGHLIVQNSDRPDGNGNVGGINAQHGHAQQANGQRRWLMFGRRR